MTQRELIFKPRPSARHEPMLAQARPDAANRRRESIFRAFFPFFRESEFLREADKAAVRATGKKEGGKEE